MSTFAVKNAAAFRHELREFGEVVTYCPRNGRARAITAIVDRNPVEAVDESGAASPSPYSVVKVLEDCEDATYGGIDPAELDSGVDKLSYEARKGRKPELRTIRKPIEQGEGVMWLEVR